jgi:thioredoxin reductase
MESTEKEILIIGGGIAGMSAGIYARQNGYRTTILEMGTNSGGQLTAWQRQGYTLIFACSGLWAVIMASTMTSSVKLAPFSPTLKSFTMTSFSKW